MWVLVFVTLMGGIKAEEVKQFDLFEPCLEAAGTINYFNKNKPVKALCIYENNRTN
jgi:hypothetical protein